MEEITTAKPKEHLVGPSSASNQVTVHQGKKQLLDRCFPFMEISLDPGIKSLRHLDSRKFKLEIQRWAKAVVQYARQVSDRFSARQVNGGSSRS